MTMEKPELKIVSPPPEKPGVSPFAQPPGALNLRGVAFENRHAPAFRAWQGLDPAGRREALRDRYVFFSIAHQVAALLKQGSDTAGGLLGEILEDISFLAGAQRGHAEEWFRGLDQLVQALIDGDCLAEARRLADIAVETGVAKFPRIAQSVHVNVAYLDAIAGRTETAEKMALYLVRRPYLLPDRRELPKTIHKLLHILSATGHMAEFRLILWEGAMSIHAREVLRDSFLAQIVTTYRGALRAAVNPGVPLSYRLAFLIGNSARLLAKDPLLKALQVPVPLRVLHLFVLSLLKVNMVSHRKAFAARKAAMSPVNDAGAPAQRILVTRAMGGIGDILMMTPGLRALATRYPGAQIDFAVPKNFHTLFEGLHGVRPVDINEGEIDVGSYARWVNLTDCPAGRAEARQYPNVRRNRIEIFAGAMGISIRRLKATGFRPFYRLTEEDEAGASATLKGFNPDGLPVVGIQPFSVDSYKNWPFMEEAARRLAADHCVLVFHHEEMPGFNGKNIHKVIVPLRKSIALLSRCRALLAVDSSFVHIAACLDIRTAAVFGPTSGDVFCRYYPNARVLAPAKQDFACNPCWRNEHKPCHLTQGRESICLRSIAVDQALAALNDDAPGRPAPARGLWNRLKLWVLYGRK